jgi:hypothetical protein
MTVLARDQLLAASDSLLEVGPQCEVTQGAGAVNDLGNSGSAFAFEQSQETSPIAGLELQLELLGIGRALMNRLPELLLAALPSFDHAPLGFFLLGPRGAACLDVLLDVNDCLLELFATISALPQSLVGIVNLADDCGELPLVGDGRALPLEVLELKLPLLLLLADLRELVAMGRDLALELLELSLPPLVPVLQFPDLRRGCLAFLKRRRNTVVNRLQLHKKDKVLEYAAHRCPLLESPG